MTEARQISRTRHPVTSASLAADLRALGLRAGELVIAHSSLSALGWVNGGAVAVIEALLDTLGPQGTLVMPSQSPHLSDPANWSAPPVPETWWDTIRATMPAYDPRSTPTSGMGRVAEAFRGWPGAIRSAHPANSFVALGPLAAAVMREHRLEDPFGPSSPLAELHRRDARILLIGVGFDACTALHFAEHRAWARRPLVREGAPLMVNGRRQWVRFEIAEPLDSERFVPVGASALAAGIGAQGPLGEGRGVLVAMRPLIDHALRCWSEERDGDAPSA
ncbi:aminoglycoside N(3)-acetyltransferase [Burkholderia gladioli]|uniref:aminoglycoside N(3)-acetyltransferase n=1 Tax=Burkholderia gladioli TaxID=28095 RepID=UPI00163E8AD3|nr:AAC(3) family N-acetyltransferase [Burkholderia gladioli]